MAPFIPEDLTPLTLATAQGKQLAFWAKQINSSTGSQSARNNIIKTSRYPKVDDLRGAVAAYCGFDLTSTSSTGQPEESTVLTVDQSIINRQWDDLLALGKEWEEDIKAGRVFRLQKDSNNAGLRLGFTRTSELDATLARFSQIHPTGIQPSSIKPDDLALITQDTLSMWITHAELHNLLALSALHGIYQALNPVTGTISDIACASNLPQSVANNPLPSVNPGPETQNAMLSACDEDILALDFLNKETGLRQAISQVENGLVNQVRGRYGPKDGKRGTADAAVWDKLKVAITRRERVYKVLQNDFLGNKEAFFMFFTAPTSSRKRGSKGKEKEAGESLRSY
ncbi:hypothetical protein C8J56DRAFT_891752 [Mycena floridula]|nr:hypothetical protein C8J56DRAFT_891752 [Mycena floridula]